MEATEAGTCTGEEEEEQLANWQPTSTCVTLLLAQHIFAQLQAGTLPVELKKQQFVEVAFSPQGSPVHVDIDAVFRRPIRAFLRSRRAETGICMERVSLHGAGIELNNASENELTVSRVGRCRGGEARQQQ